MATKYDIQPTSSAHVVIDLPAAIKSRRTELITRVLPITVSSNDAVVTKRECIPAYRIALIDTLSKGGPLAQFVHDHRIVMTSIVILSCYLVLGTAVMHRLEGWPLVQSFQWACATVTSVG